MKNLTMLSGAGIRTSDSNHKGKQRQIKRRLDPRPSVALVLDLTGPPLNAVQVLSVRKFPFLELSPHWPLPSSFRDSGYGAEASIELIISRPLEFGRSTGRYCCEAGILI